MFKILERFREQIHESQWLRKWIDIIFKEEETGANLNNIRRQKNINHDDLLK
jgi:hypothetical protein